MGDSRPETGPMRFDDDWTGVFIRGDNAFAFYINLKQALEALAAGSEVSGISLMYLRALATLLRSCDETLVEGRPAAQVATLAGLHQEGPTPAPAQEPTEPLTMETVAENLAKDVYRAALWYERAEGAGLIYGNGHHLAQDLSLTAVDLLQSRKR